MLQSIDRIQKMIEFARPIKAMISCGYGVYSFLFMQKLMLGRLVQTRRHLGHCVAFCADMSVSAVLNAAAKATQKIHQGVHVKTENNGTMLFVRNLWGGENPKMRQSLQYIFDIKKPQITLLAAVMTNIGFAFVRTVAPTHALAKTDYWGHRRPRQPVSHIEKYRAEGSMTRSVWSVLRAALNLCSAKPAFSEITTMTEQRRCAAA